MKEEFNEISTLNYKLKSQVEHQEGQLKLQQKNVDLYKQKISSSDERLQNLMTSNAKMETLLSNLNVEMRNSDAELRNLRRKNENLTQQNQNLIRMEAKLKAESEVFQRQNQLQGHMMSNLEFIRTSLERSENESRAKMEEKFEELNSEYLSIKSQLEQERSEYREFEQKVNEALAEKDDEVSQLHQALTKAYEDLEKYLVEKKDVAIQHDVNEEIIPMTSQSFISCASTIESSFNLVNSNHDEMDTAEGSSNKGCSKKRGRDSDDDDEQEIEIISGEKRVKMSKIDEISTVNEISKCIYHVW